MKRLVVTSLLALAVLAGSQQKASAWCKFNCNLGLNICFESSGWWCSWAAGCCPAPCCGPSCCPALPNCPYGALAASPYAYGGMPGYDGGMAYGGAVPGHAAAPPAAPPAQAPQATGGKPAGVYPVSYYPQYNAGYTGGYGYTSGYGYGSAPSYWYGR
jgi:hypothetical protein